MTNKIEHGTKRTDALRPGVFDPSDFQVVTYVDLEEFRDGGRAPAMREWEQDLVDTFGEARTLATLNYFGYLEPTVSKEEIESVNPLYVCDHCGAKNLRYIAAVRQLSTGDVFVFGSSCVARAELKDRAEFKLVQLKKLAANRRERLRLAEVQAHYLNANEDIRKFICSIERGEQGEAHDSFGFVNSLDGSLNKYGELTVKQAASLRKVIAKRIEFDAKKTTWEAERIERDARKGPAPEGRQTVRGEVVKLKIQDGYMGGTDVYKAVVRLENESAVWITVPRRIEDDYYASWQKADLEWFETRKQAIAALPLEVKEQATRQGGTWNLPIDIPERPVQNFAGYLEGKKVEVTATFTVSDRDEHFAFGKRPIVKIINEEEN